MRRTTLLICLLSSIVWSSCKEDKNIHKPAKGGVVPDKITDASVIPLAGAAIIYYTIPDFDNTSYVLAEYTLDNGKVFQAKSSKFNDSIRVDGFPKMGAYNVNLYTVGSGEQRSEPLSVKINVLKPAYITTFDSLKVSPAFGGLFITSKNKAKGDLAITVLESNGSGEDSIITRYFTQSEDIELPVHGLKAIESTFKIYVRDRWLNNSDTLVISLTPKEEEMVDRNKIKVIQLHGDVIAVYSGYTMDKLFNGILTGGSFTPSGSGMPQHFTVDLNDIYSLSRIKVWMRLEDKYVYSSISVKAFNVWGSLNPNPNGDMDSTWTLLGGPFEFTKPSGSPIGTITSEDKAKALEGTSFDFGGGGSIPVRYIRFETLRTWGGTDWMSMAEIEFYGNKL